ncbi:MAG: cell division ATP-binding protein FtsE [Bacteroidales bacterium]
MDILLKYEGVDVYRQENRVLKDVELELRCGEFVYLIGRVGTGKSSLLKTIYAEIPITLGMANVLGYDMLKIKRKHIPLLRRKLGVIFQDFQLLIDRSVSDNLEFVLRATGWKDRKEIANRIHSVLELVGMDTKGYKMPHELSGGEQQRIVIARALLNEPEIILADEPTGNLDPETARQIVSLLYDISKKGTTVVMATHNLNFSSHFPGRVLNCEDESLVEIAVVDGQIVR